MSEIRAENDNSFSKNGFLPLGHAEKVHPDGSFSLASDAVTLNSLQLESCIKNADLGVSGEVLNASSASTSSGSSGRTLAHDFNEYSNIQSRDVSTSEQGKPSSTLLGGFMANVPITAAHAGHTDNSGRSDCVSHDLNSQVDYAKPEISGKYISNQQEFSQQSNDEEDEEDREFTPLARTVSVSPSSRSASPLPIQDETGLFGYSSVFPMYGTRHHGHHHPHGMLHSAGPSALSSLGSVVHPSFVYKSSADGFFRHTLENALPLGPESAFAGPFAQGALQYQLERTNNVENNESVLESSGKSISSTFALNTNAGYGSVVQFPAQQPVAPPGNADESNRVVQDKYIQSKANLQENLHSISPQSKSAAEEKNTSSSTTQVQNQIQKEQKVQSGTTIWQENLLNPKDNSFKAEGTTSSGAQSAKEENSFNASEYLRESDESGRSVNVTEGPNIRPTPNQFERSALPATTSNSRSQTSVGYNYGAPTIGAGSQGQVAGQLGFQMQRGISREQAVQNIQQGKLFGNNFTPVSGTMPYNAVSGNFYSIGDYVSPNSSISNSAPGFISDASGARSINFMDKKLNHELEKTGTDIQPGDSASQLVDNLNNSKSGVHSSDSTSQGQSTTHIARADRIPRPENSFFLYRRRVYANVVEKNPGKTNPEISKIISAMWKKEGPTVKRLFKELSIKTKLDHERKYPNYKYQPRRDKKQKKKLGQQLSNAQISPVTGSRLQSTLSGQTTSKVPSSSFPHQYAAPRSATAIGSMESKLTTNQMQNPQLAPHMAMHSQFSNGIHVGFPVNQRKQYMPPNSLSSSSNSNGGPCIVGSKSQMTTGQQQYFHGGQRINGTGELLPFYTDDNSNVHHSARQTQNFALGRMNQPAAENGSFKPPAFALQSPIQAHYSARFPQSPVQQSFGQFSRPMEYPGGSSRVVIGDRMPQIYALSPSHEPSFSIHQGVINVSDQHAFRNNQVGTSLSATNDLAMNRHQTGGPSSLKVLGGNVSGLHENNSGVSLGYEPGMTSSFNYPASHSFTAQNSVEARQMQMQFHGRQSGLSYHSQEQNGPGQGYTQLQPSNQQLSHQQTNSLHYGLPQTAGGYHGGNSQQFSSHQGIHGAQQHSPQQKQSTSQQSQVQQHSQHQAQQSQTQAQQAAQSSFSMPGNSLLGVQFDFSS